LGAHFSAEKYHLLLSHHPPPPPPPPLFLLGAKLQKILPKQNQTPGITYMDDLVIIQVGYQS